MGGNDNTIMMKAVGFHFILSSHVGMNLENDISGQLEYEQFVCAQNEFAKGNLVHIHLFSLMNP